jgi:uncharacterized cupredoxin-like copper-binding protein
MSDLMRFSPSVLQARAGETVRIVAHNDGAVPHELVIGAEATLRGHAQGMRDGPGHAHAPGAAITVAPGQVGELVVSFTEPAALQIACLLPGHFEAGMRGSFDVVAAATTAVSTQVPAAARPVHDHQGHRH